MGSPSITIASKSGFCVGVERAVKMAFKCANTNTGNVYMLGELIHNRFVNEQLRELGVVSTEDLSQVENGTIIIRSHGITKSVYDYLSSKPLNIVDATCIYVKSIQNKVEKYHQAGYTIVIVGDRAHPEVIGVNGWCSNEAIIISTLQEAQNSRLKEPVCIVAQTTFIKELFTQISNYICMIHNGTLVFDTICQSTALRQKAAADLAKKSDAMIVIGGKNSSNTAKLEQICRQHCSQVINIEAADEINVKDFSECSSIGVTAGASTPSQIILEVKGKMENIMENFEESIENLKQFRTGDIVTGEIISVNEAEIYVNIGHKSDGIIKKADFLQDLYSDLTSSAAIGDQIEAMVIDMNDGTGNIVLSKIRVDELAAQDKTEEAFKSGEILTGKITKIVKGGVIVDIGFSKPFMPGNQYALKYTEDLNALLGKEVEGRIIEFDRDRNKIIFSRKVVLLEIRNAEREEKERRKKEALDSLELSQVVNAPVKNVADFGVFIDLNGIDGFIHVSDLAWRRISNPKNLFKTGDMIEAIVTELDKEAGKVKLSVKALTPEPWQTFIEGYKANDTTKAIIKSVVKFGAFAEIIPGVEGLIHISNLSHDKVPNVESVVNVNDEVTVKIIEIDNDKRKIGLSIKDLTEAPKRKIEQDKAYYKEDSKVTMEHLFKKYLGE
ncbi:MAG: bifunctional 4-hydroxy-3-methylbut-2-enyl diphosphate reductase/30S ribosomal protein S1 [Eubacteriaceae bacterium]|nr:bifunctional 4-hydroxy-3-methylbut-2-enyl diphosphate reductase/30S ribosomal protein S1 [Eubacteriaceae bacterium]